MDTRLVRLLEDGISHIDGTLLSGNVPSRLARLYDEITLFNPMYGLVNASDEELVVRHILDCLAPVPLFRKMDRDGIRMADLGSGSGLPGLVLASVFGNWDISLVERMGRRAGFLRNTIAVLGMNNHVRVVQKDLSEVRDGYDIVTFRAFRHIQDIISDLDRILVPGGKVFSYKSSDENIREELQVVESYAGCPFAHEVADYRVPMLDATRKMLILSKPLMTLNQ
ncbi:MAG: 16S rRNA (guanine(527)-N(7))-methyltransferase RsmG [Spirochaetales bacterium]|nr:16S rRNA (guanine(527)-N(7))-methyltransferase RsmG [Spirochaetales bacterium]